MIYTKEKMKRTLLFVTLLAAALFVSCQKEDPVRPSVSWPSNEKVGQMELAPGADGSISLSAPSGFESITITLNLGVYNILANQYIGNTNNKGSVNKSAILDLIDDSSVAAFIQDLGFAAGSGLRGKTITTINLVTVLNKLITGQTIDNNTTFLMDVAIVDKSGNGNKPFTARFHFTAAPSFTWDGNSTFDPMDLAEVKPAKIKVHAPGKIAKLQVALESGVPELTSYIKNRTTGNMLVIDLVNDPKVADSFKGYFPAGTNVTGKTEVTLDFAFLFAQSYDFSEGTNVFTIFCEDANAKTATAQVRFRK